MSAAASAEPGRTAVSEGGLRALLALAAFVGLVEGVAIVRYDVLMHEVGVARLAAALAWLAAIVGLHVAVWGALAWSLARVLPTDRAQRLCFALWLAAAAASRALALGDALGLLLWLPLAACVLALPRAPHTFLETPVQRALLALIAVLWVAGVGLRGQVPGAAVGGVAAFWALSAGLALGLFALAKAAPRLLAGVVLAALASVAVVDATAVRPQGPSVLLVLVDTLRRDHLDLYGDRVSTPAIQRLAAEGVRFDDAVTVVPKTPASVASLFTGRYPIRHGVRTLYEPLPAEERTLAERFAAAGYRTAGLVDNPWIARGRGFEQGFQRFAGYYELQRPYGPLRYTSWLRFFDALGPRRIRAFSGETRASQLTDAALEVLADQGAEPFFVYVHYFAPHWPYLPPADLIERYGAPEPDASRVNHPDRHGIDRGRMIFQNDLPEADNEQARRLYRAEVHDTMAEVGRLIDGLDALGRRDSTIVAFTADHGHSLGEHAYHYHHGSFLYDAELRIPLILRWPGQLPAGAVVETPVRSIDTAPTLLELAGLEPAADADGRSLVPQWRGEAEQVFDTFLESDVKMFAANTRREREGVSGKLRGLRTGRHKLLLIPTLEGPRWQLFDLASDPGETRDLAGLDSHAEILSALQQRLLAWLPASEREALEGDNQSAVTGPAREVDEAELELLRELGYAE